jgi:hypothetical protein
VIVARVGLWSAVALAALQGCYQDVTYGAPGYVQGSGTYQMQSGNTDTTLSIELPQPVTTGDDILVFVGTFEATNSVPVDTAGNTYVQLVAPTPTLAAPDASSLALYVATDVGSATALTISVSATSIGGMHSFTILGLEYVAGAPVHPGIAQGLGSTNPQCTVNGTTSQQVVVAGLAIDSIACDNTVEPGDGFTTVAEPNDDLTVAPVFLVEDAIAQNGSTTATFSTAVENNWVCEAAVFDAR